MCNRYVYKHSGNELKAYFEIKGKREDLADLFEPRYNIAPTNDVLGVRLGNTGAREFCRLAWDLVPAWAKDAKAGPRPLNARSETAASKPTFREALRRRRCLMPASGFYEWQRDGLTRPQPYYFAGADGRPLAFGALWEHWEKPDGSSLETCCMLTTMANALMGKIHDRMPVLFHPKDFDRWLCPGNQDPSELTELFTPPPESYLTCFPVSKRVNSVKEQGADLIQPVVNGKTETGKGHDEFF